MYVSSILHQKSQINIILKILNSIYAGNGKFFLACPSIWFFFFSRTFNLQKDIKITFVYCSKYSLIVKHCFGISIHFFYKTWIVLLVSPDFSPVTLIKNPCEIMDIQVTSFLWGYIISQPGFQHLKHKHVSLSPL